MHKRIFWLLYPLSFFLLFQHAAAQSGSSARAHGSVGLASMSESHFDSGFWSRFGFSFQIKENLNLSFNFGAWKSQTSTKPDGLQDGSLLMNPFFVTLKYIPGRGGRTLSPYLFVGGGYIFTSFRMGDIVTIPEISLSQKVNNSLGGEAGAGICLELSERISLNADVSYLFNHTTGITTIQDLNFGTNEEDFPLNLSALIFQIGISFLI